MLNGVTFACVLAARAGSKRLKDKNVRKCVGKPLWLWTKEAVEAAGIFDEKILTTDINEFMHSSAFGGWFFNRRPSALAADDTHISDVMQYLIGEPNFPSVEYLCLVSPTNPLRTGQHIRDAAKLMLKEEADAVVAVAPCHPRAQNLNLLNGHVPSVVSSFIGAQTQSLRPTYRLTGSIVIAKTELWLRKASLYNDPNIKTVGYVMPKWDIDIDTKDDLFMAEAMIECLRKRRTSLKSSIKSVLRGRHHRNSNG